MRKHLGTAGEGGGKRRLRSLLVVLETAVSFVLLIAAGLLTRSLLRLQEVPLGFHPANVLTSGISLPRAQYSKPEQWIGFYGRLVESLKSQPGVEAVAAVLPLPLTGGGLNFAFTIEGRATEKAGNDRTANYTASTPEYFRVLRVPLLKGRLFSAMDAATAPRVCLVSSAFAKRYFPEEDPIGKRLVFGFKENVPHQIVGVVGDVMRDGIGAPCQPGMYVPFEQDPWWAAYIAIRTKGGPEELAAALRREVRALDPSLPLADIQPMTQFVYDSVAQPRFRTTLVALFGATALLLAIIGSYGVISDEVGRRSREIGLRLALGAGRGDVLGLVLRHGLALTGLGLAAGLAGAAIATWYLSSLLFEMSPLDPATYAEVAVLLLAASLMACGIPAWRALRVSPIRILRNGYAGCPSRARLSETGCRLSGARKSGDPEHSDRKHHEGDHEDSNPRSPDFEALTDGGQQKDRGEDDGLGHLALRRNPGREDIRG
ncbi:MAG TPA: ABC transporter permease [Thermoanaerobaculia bacterium]|nr:ABC transporter permease [Thermoanaerobaculia bacterium]